MNKKSILTVGFYALLCLIFSSCSSTNYLTMSVVEPAPVYVPKFIQRVGIIDQTLPHKETKKLDDLDKILTVEGKNLDKDGANAALLGLFNELTKHGRFSEIKVIEDAGIKSPGMGIFPAAIPWSTVKEICSKNNVDALFVLSFYDTDTKVNYSTIPTQITNPLGIKIPAVEHQAIISTRIKAGWRIYDPSGKILLDEFVSIQDLSQSGRGITPIQAVQAVLGRKEAVMESSRRLGEGYSYRILPFSIRVRRNYYVRGTDNFKIAKRRAQTGNWDGAAELWLAETTHPKSKVAGRAAYNMAIINEINGDLDAAVEWASKSYTDYKNKLALDYLRILKNRIRKQNILEQESQ